MVEKLILPKIVELIEQRHFDELKAAIVEFFPQDIAELIGELEADHKGILFRLLPKDLATEVFENLTKIALTRRTSPVGCSTEGGES